jgi:hypothetical protein
VATIFLEALGMIDIAVARAEPAGEGHRLALVPTYSLVVPAHNEEAVVDEARGAVARGVTTWSTRNAGSRTRRVSGGQARALIPLPEPDLGQAMAVDVGDFRLVDRQALAKLSRMRESNGFVRGMFGWIGLRQTRVLYTRHERFAGDSKYPLSELVRLGWSGVTSFSEVPLRAAPGVQSRALLRVPRVRGLEFDREAGGYLQRAGMDGDRRRGDLP